MKNKTEVMRVTEGEKMLLLLLRQPGHPEKLYEALSIRKQITENYAEYIQSPDCELDSTEKKELYDLTIRKVRLYKEMMYQLVEMG